MSMNKMFKKVLAVVAAGAMTMSVLFSFQRA